MGILNKLINEGSSFSTYNGATPLVNPLATQQSKLHADGNSPGYSLDGSQASLVTSQYNNYLDGITNPPPSPSLLDLNGVIPSVSSTPGSTQQLPYLDHLPT